MKPRTRTGLNIEGRPPTIRHLLLLSLIVGTSVLTAGTAAVASPAAIGPEAIRPAAIQPEAIRPAAIQPAAIQSAAIPVGVSAKVHSRAVVVAQTAADRCARVARNVGYRTKQRLVTAVAVGMGESRCRTSVRHWSRPTAGCRNGSIDRGMWQINGCYHPEVSISCAYDAQCSAWAAYRISRHGTNWNPWSAYKNGHYRRYLGQARAAVDRLR
jgi:Lysozyme like domain